MRWEATMRRWGAGRAGAWLVIHVVSPLDRALYRWSGGRGLSLGRKLAPRLLLTTTGRRTGRERTTPVFYLRDGERLIICNVNPGLERPIPWTLNLRAQPVARVQIGRQSGTYRARLATDDEVERYWPRFVELWPAYQTYFQRSGQRTIFILDRDDGSAGHHEELDR
jgi:deazaflavin-dependent oxidoreductase (nitroreductase family)